MQLLYAASSALGGNSEGSRMIVEDYVKLSTSNYPHQEMTTWHFGFKFMVGLCSRLCLKFMPEAHG